MRFARKSALGSAAAVFVVAGWFAAPTGATTPQSNASTAKCTPPLLTEAIIDDSGSMTVTDPNRLRVSGMKILINSLNANQYLGAVGFGTSAFTIFAPQQVGPNAASMGSALSAQIHGSHGSTDYNAAFAQSFKDNPYATARIFLTDGGHNAGAYNNGHLNPNVPTYVIGFADATTSAPDKARLKKIASDTGGNFYAQKTSGQVQSFMNDIASRLSCHPLLTRVADKVHQGATKTHSAKIPKGTSKARITVTWASPKDQFTVSGVKEPGHKLGISKANGKTFVVLKVSKLGKGKLFFRVTASKIRSLAGAKVTVVSQVGKG